MHNIDRLIQSVYDIVKSHELPDGGYARWIWQNKDNTRELGINPYGCADAANILYTIGRFPKDEETRRRCVNALRGLQSPESGLFVEATHHPIHTTAHCIASLELFDAEPQYKPLELLKYSKPEDLINFLETLDWVNDPWNMSHRGAGLFVSMVLTESVDKKWQDTYFNWLWENTDEKTGLLRKGAVGNGSAPLFHHFAGTFHYMFNIEYAKMPLRYPDKIIDTLLSYYDDEKTIYDLSRQIGFLPVDWVYCITRARRQTPHRFDECTEALTDFAERYIERLQGLDSETDDGINDLHGLFGALCCLAELQQALPGFIKSEKPLKLVLDRRPFI